MVVKKLSWENIFDLLKPIDKNTNIVYGIPKGGMIASAFLKQAKITHIPQKANIILDDLIDSGATQNKYTTKYPHIPFHALVNKKDNNWIIFPWETDHPQGENEGSIKENIVRVLQFIGEDIKREGLVETPNRIIKSWQKDIFTGYDKNPEDLLTTFHSDGYNQIILLKDIEIFSMCEHHMLPFFGTASIAYIPNKRIIGVSKLARLIDIYARRLQIQERIGEQVTKDLMEYLQPKGAACIIKAVHMCMRMRGVSKQRSTMVTSSVKGVFFEDSKARQELFELMK